MMKDAAAAPPGKEGDTPARRLRNTWIAALFGVAFALLTFTPGFVAGTGPYFEQPRGDIAGGQIGWRYYAREDWHFPLFGVEGHNQPEGSVLTLSDSLPLLGLPAKIVYQATGWMPVYIGFWMALCFVLQAVCASRLLDALGIRDVPTQIAGMVLFCYVPILFVRLGHATLICHFVLLIALERYVTAKRVGLGSRGWMALGALPALGMCINPNIVVMSAIVVGLTVVDQWRDGRIGFAGAAVRLGGSAAAAIAVGVIGGSFSGGGQPNLAYGVFSLNLAAPFTPLAGTTLGQWLGTAQPNLPSAKQGEGTAYLGAGVILLCLFALPALRNWREGLRRHGVLLAVLVAMLVFAVSNRIGFGAHELARVPLPDSLLRAFSEFRASGRFVWLPIYALTAAALVAVVRRYGARHAPWLLGLAAVVQVADVRPMQAFARRDTATGATATIDRTAWTELIRSHRRLFEFPSFLCGGLYGGDVPGRPLRVLEIDWIAAKLDVPNNSAYLARKIKDCARERTDAARNHAQPGTLYLYRGNESTRRYLSGAGVDFARCGRLDDVVVCSGDRDLSHLK